MLSVLHAQETIVDIRRGPLCLRVHVCNSVEVPLLYELQGGKRCGMKR